MKEVERLRTTLVKLGNTYTTHKQFAPIGHVGVRVFAVANAGTISGNARSMRQYWTVPAALLLAVFTFCSIARADTEALYQNRCADCHGIDRLGASGPALVPALLSRMHGSGIADIILNGRFGTEMPAFADQISPDDAELLSSYLNAPLPERPTWDKEQTIASRAMDQDYIAGDSPTWTAEPLNITLVVEAGNNQITVMNGDNFDVLDRFEALTIAPGGLQFGPDGRYAFILSRDGWVEKYDIWALHSVGRVRAGLSSSALAVSHDGDWLAVANDLPNTLTFLKTSDLSVAGIVPIVGKGGMPSRISAIYLAPPRNRFVLTLRDVSEIWEVFYGPNPPFYGFVHDYRVEGPPSIEEPFPVRQITRVDFLDGFFFDPTFEYIIGSSRGDKGGFVVDLVIGQKVADLDLQGAPFPGTGAAWMHGDKAVVAAPQMSGDSISVIDTKSWKVLKRIQTEGAGTFIKTHDKSPHVWADVFVGNERKALHVIDKQNLEIVKTLRFDERAAISNLAFGRDGSHVLVSLGGEDGAVVAYDARSLEEVKRLPMQNPWEIFNVSSTIHDPQTE